MAYSEFLGPIHHHRLSPHSHTSQGAQLPFHPPDSSPWLPLVTPCPLTTPPARLSLYPFVENYSLIMVLAHKQLASSQLVPPSYDCLCPPLTSSHSESHICGHWGELQPMWILSETAGEGQRGQPGNGGLPAARQLRLCCHSRHSPWQESLINVYPAYKLNQ